MKKWVFVNVYQTVYTKSFSGGEWSIHFNFQLLYKYLLSISTFLVNLFVSGNVRKQ